MRQHMRMSAWGFDFSDMRLGQIVVKQHVTLECVPEPTTGQACSLFIAP